MQFPHRLDDLFPPGRWMAELESAFSDLFKQSDNWNYADLINAGMDPVFLDRAFTLTWTRFPVHEVLATIRNQQTMEPEQLPAFLEGFRNLYQESIRLNKPSLLHLLSVQSRLDILFRLSPVMVFDLFVFGDEETIPFEGLRDFLPVLPDDFLLKAVLTAYLTQKRATEYEKVKITGNIRKILSNWWNQHPAEKPHEYLNNVLLSVQADALHRDVFASFASHLPDAMLNERVRRWINHAGDEFISREMAVNVLTGTWVPPVETVVSMDFTAEEPEEEIPAGIRTAGQLTDVLTTAIREEVEHRVNEREAALREAIQQQAPPSMNFSPAELPDLTPDVSDEPVAIEPLENEQPEGEPVTENVVNNPAEEHPHTESNPPKQSLFDLVADPDVPAITSGSFIPVSEAGKEFSQVATPKEPEEEKPEPPKKSLFDIVTGEDEPVSEIDHVPSGEAVNLDQPAEKQPESPILQTDLFAAANEEGPVLPVLEQMITESQAKIFIRYLFKKDEQQFYQAIHDLNDMTTWEDARKYLDRIFKEFKVDLYSNEALEFTDIIFSRFN